MLRSDCRLAQVPLSLGSGRFFFTVRRDYTLASRMSFSLYRTVLYTRALLVVITVLSLVRA